MSNDDLSCSICYEEYESNGNLVPIVLSCSGITYCQGCLQTMKNTGNKECPCCRKSFDSIALIKNIALIKILEERKTHPQGIPKVPVATSRNYFVIEYFKSLHLTIKNKFKVNVIDKLNLNSHGHVYLMAALVLLIPTLLWQLILMSIMLLYSHCELSVLENILVWNHKNYSNLQTTNSPTYKFIIDKMFILNNSWVAASKLNIPVKFIYLIGDIIIIAILLCGVVKINFATLSLFVEVIFIQVFDNEDIYRLSILIFRALHLSLFLMSYFNISTILFYLNIMELIPVLLAVFLFFQVPSSTRDRGVIRTLNDIGYKSSSINVSLYHSIISHVFSSLVVAFIVLTYVSGIETYSTFQCASLIHWAISLVRDYISYKATGSYSQYKWQFVIVLGIIMVIATFLFPHSFLRLGIPSADNYIFMIVSMILGEVSMMFNAAFVVAIALKYGLHTGVGLLRILLLRWVCDAGIKTFYTMKPITTQP